jgi:hypothetical protein
MRRTDGQARALYRLITLPIRAALKTATFVPEEGADGGDEEAAFIQDMFTLPVTGGGMSVPFGRIIAQMLMAVFDGFAAFEMVYWQPDDGPLKGKWTLKKLAHRPSEQLTFLLNDNSEFVGLRQQTMYHDRQIDVVIDADNVSTTPRTKRSAPSTGCPTSTPPTGTGKRSSSSTSSRTSPRSAPPWAPGSALCHRRPAATRRPPSSAPWPTWASPSG